MNVKIYDVKEFLDKLEKLSNTHIRYAMLLTSIDNMEDYILTRTEKIYIRPKYSSTYISTVKTRRKVNDLIKIETKRFEEYNKQQNTKETGLKINITFDTKKPIFKLDKEKTKVKLATGFYVKIDNLWFCIDSTCPKHKFNFNLVKFLKKGYGQNLNLKLELDLIYERNTSNTRQDTYYTSKHIDIDFRIEEDSKYLYVYSNKEHITIDMHDLRGGHKCKKIRNLKFKLWLDTKVTENMNMILISIDDLDYYNELISRFLKDMRRNSGIDIKRYTIQLDRYMRRDWFVITNNCIEVSLPLIIIPTYNYNFI